MSSLAYLLSVAQERGLERLDAQLLLLLALDRSTRERAWLLAHDAQEASAATQARYETYVERSASGEPLAYITGHKEFFGLDLLVDARVLVPRPETETLVSWALEALKVAVPGVAPASVLDLGTGSGAIALALKATRSDLNISAIDCSEDALQVARSNAQRLQLDVQFGQSSWFDSVSSRFQVIVANPPYVGAHDQHLAALAHEPLQALSSGADGLTDLRQIINEAPPHLHTGGWLLLEHGYDQARAVRALLRDAGFSDIQSRRDLSGIERCSGGCLKGA